MRVTLAASGADPTSADSTLLELSAAQRVKRAAVVFGAAVALAAALIPVPIVHLLGIPLALLVGAVVAIRQLRAAVRLAPVRIPCPKCGAPQLLGGFGLRTATEPIERSCDSCRRPLVMRIAVR